MPWKIREGGEDCPFEVVNEDSGERVACHPTKEKAKEHLAALYANEPEARNLSDKPRAEIEHRDAAVGDVNFAQRIITVVAAPYEQPAFVPFRGEVWKELFERSAFMGVEKRPNRIRANRDHDKKRTVGKALRFWPDREEGLVSEVRIAQTALGDETLALADDDCLSASVGFGVLPQDQQLDRASRTRRIKTAYLDHLAFVESPAYEGADVIGVRSADSSGVDPKLLESFLALLKGEQRSEHVTTPNLDQFTEDDILRWASERLNK